MKLIISAVMFLFINIAAFAQSGALVSVVQPEQGNIMPTRSYIADIAYTTSARIPAERAGRVDTAPFEEGMSVKKGDILLSINRDVLMHNISASEKRLEQERLALDKSKRDFDRISTLYRQNATTELRYLDAETDYAVKQSAYATAEAELAVYREDLKRSIIIAPYDAVIVKKDVDVGEWVNTGTVVFEIVEKRLEAVVKVPQSVAAYMKPGLPVDVTVENHNYKGKVRIAVPLADIVSRTFPIKIDIPYTTELMGGMDAVALVPLGNAVPVTLLPIDAVVVRNNGNVVFTVKDNAARMISVEVVGYTGAKVGLIPAEPLGPVVTRGNEYLAEGQNVRIAN